MTTNIDSTLIAFLLAFQDLKTSLTSQEKDNLQEVAKELKTQPEAWEPYIKNRLLEIISANYELNKSYEFYHSQLENSEKIPHELLPNETEIRRLITLEEAVIDRGFKPESEAIGYERQLNNVVVIIGSSEKPEETVKQVKSLEKLKQFLFQFNQSN